MKRLSSPITVKSVLKFVCRLVRAFPFAQIINGGTTLTVESGRYYTRTSFKIAPSGGVKILIGAGSFYSFCTQALYLPGDKAAHLLQGLMQLVDNSAFHLPQYFSAGLSSVAYGGRNSSATLWVTTSRFALWKAPLSISIIFSSGGLRLEDSFRKTWSVTVLQPGISSSKWSPVRSEKPPNRYSDWNTCWNKRLNPFGR